MRRDDDGRFCLGLRLIGLGHEAAEAVPVWAAARPALAWLHEQTGESVQLFVRDGDARVCVESIESPRELRTIVPVGARLPAVRRQRRPGARRLHGAGRPALGRERGGARGGRGQRCRPRCTTRAAGSSRRCRSAARSSASPASRARSTATRWPRPRGSRARASRAVDRLIGLTGDMAANGAMTKAEREAFLADVHVGVLAVDEPGRGPLALPIWYLVDGDDIVMSISAGSAQGAAPRRRAVGRR